MRGPTEASIGQVVAMFGGSPHLLACSPGLGSGSACWDLSPLTRLVTTILHDSNSPGLLHSGPRNSTQWGQVWTLALG